MPELEGVQCTATETGICGLHNVEIERRKHQSRLIDGLKQDVDNNANNVISLFKICGVLTTFTGQAKVVGIIASAIFASSFWYTYDHKADSSRTITTLQIKLDHDHEQLLILQGSQRLLDQRISQIVATLKSTDATLNNTNDRLTSLIRKLPDLKQLSNED